MRWLAALSVCILAVSVSTAADREATATRLDDGMLPADKCSEHCVGNFNSPAATIENAIVGDEGFKYLFRPPIYQCACPDGFRVDKVHMLIEFGEEDVSAMFSVYADLESPAWDDAAGCWVPGIQECVTPTFNFVVAEAGIYDISIPIFEDCECAYMDYWYFLGVFFEGSFPEDKRPNIVTDEYNIGCRSYHDPGTGWQDLSEEYADWPGELVIWAEVDCCDDPVGNESNTWSGVKSLYR